MKETADFSLKLGSPAALFCLSIVAVGSAATLWLTKAVIVSSQQHHHYYPTIQTLLFPPQTTSFSSSHINQSNRSVPDKLAFMFLTRGKLPLRPLWEKFFDGCRKDAYSIYIHTSPDYTDEPPKSSVFFGRRITSKQVEWGRASVVEAERRLLSNALSDSANEWFILLSETCIPLYNFTFIYNFLADSNQSFLGSFDDPRTVGRGRYNKQMSPLVTLQDWRKGSQWFAIRRKVADGVVADSKYFPIFAKYCQPPCYMDEHYFPTLVTKLFPELNSNRTVTWVDWSRGGSHPATFRDKDVNEWLLFSSIRNGSSCTNSSDISSVCFLFARKFDGSALGQLLNFAPKLFA